LHLIFLEAKDCRDIKNLMILVIKNIKKKAFEHPVFSFFLLFFLTSFSIRLWPFLSIKSSWEDAYYYMELARSLSGAKFELVESFHTKYLPGFPFAILAAKIFSLNFAGYFTSAKLVSLISSSLVPGLCFILTLDITENKRAALAAGSMAMLNGLLTAYGGVPFTESLFAFQSMLALVLLRRSPASSGLVCGWAALTRHEGWFLLLALAIILLEKRNYKKIITGMTIALILAGSWWLFSKHVSGQWLYQIYTQESADRGPEMGRAGFGFLLLCFPTAGIITTLFGLVGVPVMLQSKKGRPLIIYFAAYAGLHAMWMFNVERYFLPMIPVVCIGAGCGLHTIEGVLSSKLKVNFDSSHKLIILIPLIGLIAGFSHFIGFAPAMVRQESTKTQGYLKAINYVAKKDVRMSVGAYEVFMVTVHDGKRPVVPTGAYSRPQWHHSVVDLYVNEGLRYVIWSDLYPADRDKGKYGMGAAFSIDGEVMTNQGRKKITIHLYPEKKFYWNYDYPEKSYFQLWRKSRKSQVEAIVYSLEYKG